MRAKIFLLEKALGADVPAELQKHREQIDLELYEVFVPGEFVWDAALAAGLSERSLLVAVRSFAGRTLLMIELLRAAPAHRSLLRQLYELYCHDFSPMTRADIGDDGYWTGDDFLDPWPEDLHIYLIKVDQHWAGFAWIAFGGYLDPQRRSIS